MSQPVDPNSLHECPRTSLISWSGGCDSTAEVLYHLSQRKTIRTFSVNCNQLGRSPFHKVEFATRKRLRKIIDSKYDTTFWTEHIEYNVKASGSGLHLGPKPNTMGLFTAVASTIVQQSEDFYLSFLQTDGFAYGFQFATLKRAWDLLMEASSRDSQIKCDMGTDPKPKDWVIEYLQKCKIYHHTWWCEEPVKADNKIGYKKCNKCTSCESHALYKSKIKGK